MLSKTEVLEVKYEFTRAELATIAADMNRTFSEWQRLENEKAEQSKHYAALIDAARNKCRVLNRKLECGYEMRDTVCDITYSKPQQGYKTISVQGTGEFVREIEMTPDEKRQEAQLNIFPAESDKTN